MKYGSVCSGIEAASVAWHSLGWEAQWYSEIEHFPSEVLKHRFPDVPNLGDMTQLFSNKTFLDSHIDLLVGGTPCQSFSVAGLRKGMEDPRGNLTLTFLSLIDIKKPKWIVWENVPGIISSNQGKDFQSFLDGLEEIGYICDVEILDAQHFGVAQRRKRVFVCGQSVDSILKERTITSALTIAQCLTEILHGILIEVLSLYEREPIKSDRASLLRDGVMRRMKLFGILTENCNYKNWQELLVDVFLKHHPVQKNWDLPLGGKSQKELTLEDLLMGLNQEGQSTLTEESLRKALEDLYEVMKLYTTLTLTKETIQSKISMFFQAGESISRLIARLSDSSPNSLSATLSSLTLLQELTNYARQTNSNIFSEMAGIYEVGDFLKQAQHRNAVVGYLGDWRPAAAVLFESESLQRGSKPSRAKRKETPTDAQGGVRETSDVSCAGGNVSPTVTSKWKTGYGGPSGSNEAGNMVYEPQYFESHPNDSRVTGPHDVGNTVSARYGTGGGNTPIVGQPFRKVRRAQSDTDFETWEEDDKANTLNCFDQGDVRSTNVVAQPIAYSFDSLSSNSMKSSNPHSGCREVDTSKTIDTTTPEPSKNQGGIAIAQPIAVDVYNQTIDGQTSATLTKAVGGTNTSGPKIAQPIMLDDQGGSVMRVIEDGVCGTLRRETHGHEPLVAQPVHAFKVRGGCEGGGKGYLGQDEKAFTISAMQDQQVAQHIAMEKIAGPIDASYYKGQGSRQGGEREFVAQPISLDCYNQSITGDKVGIIREQHGTNMNAIAVDAYNQTINEKTSQTIGSSASDVNHYGAVLEQTSVGALCARDYKGVGNQYVDEGKCITSPVTMAIRRLTPKECERLQGFPDDWTKIPYRNKPADQCPDGPRYKACGNSMAVPVMRWIGQRIEYVESLMKDL